MQINKFTSILKKKSFGKDFLLLSIGITVATLCAAIWLCFEILNTESHQIIRTMEGQAERIDRTILDTVDYTAYIMNYLNNQVKDHGDSDLKYVNKLYSSFRLNPDVNTHVPWNMFSWVNKDGLLIVNSDRGILKNPVDVSARDYIAANKTEPDKIHFGKVTYGKVSNQVIIPAAMGITDNNGQYLGTTIFGFQIKSLASQISGIINTDGISFALVDEDLQILIESPGNSISNNPDVIMALKKVDFNINKSGLLSKPNFWNNKVFSFYKTIPNLKYTIIVSYDRKISDNKIFYSLMGRISELLLIALTVVFSMLFLYKRIVYPITRLSDVASELASGNTEVIIPNIKNMEAANLANAMNKVKQLIINEQILNKELSLAKDNAEEANAAKSDFLANMSHELRTPLNAILGYSEIIKKQLFGNIENTQYTEYAGYVNSSGQHLLALINDILDISKAEAGHFSIYEAVFNPRNTVNECMEILSQRATEYGVTINLEIQKNLPALLGDEIRIKQIILNLVSNAIKFSNTDGTVELEMKSDNTGFYIIVRDNGIGIPQEEIGKVLEKFGQANNAMHRRKGEGSGLGLWLVKSLVEAHQGSISINSILNIGTTIVVQLPAERAMETINTAVS